VAGVLWLIRRWSAELADSGRLVAGSGGPAV